jgi:hypothetical protein
MTAWRNVYLPGETAPKTWVAEIGPVATGVMATSDFAQYSGGVLDAADCCDLTEDPTCRSTYIYVGLLMYTKHYFALKGISRHSLEQFVFWSDDVVHTIICTFIRTQCVCV